MIICKWKNNLKVLQHVQKDRKDEFFRVTMAKPRSLFFCPQGTLPSL